MTKQSPDSLGGENTIRVPLGKLTAPLSLGDQNTFSQRSSDIGDAEFGDDFEIVELSSRYTMGEVLGKGGMGEVLLATDNRLNRKVAIKRMLGEAAKSRTAVSRFLTEAKSIAALNHTNIVHVYDYGRDKSGPFLILEYVDGGSLLEVCRAGALPLDRAVDLISQVSDGLARAHDAQIIHRDIKPANVLLTRDGIPKLTDFGLAKDEANEGGLSMAGAVLGTLDFMPPEQRKDSALVDARSDLWSLAATLYQMVTGEPPRVIDLDLVPQSLRPTMAKALKAKKDDRYQTAVEFRDALRGSLKSAMVAPELSTEDLGAGECPKCHTKNEASRKFCRKCASSLEVRCLSCSLNLPVWEEVCGHCGSKQSELVVQRRGELEQQRLSAETDLRDASFAKALATAEIIRDQPDRRLQHLKSWADEFIPIITEQQKQRESSAAASFAEARTHGKSHDYEAADHAMQQIPEVLRTSGMRAYQQELRSKLGEIKQLKEELRERTKRQSFDGLMDLVDRYLVLQPNSTHVLALRGALVKRDERLAASRNEALAAAVPCFERQNYVECCQLLDGLEAAAQTAETLSLRSQSESYLERSRLLSDQIKSGLAAKEFTGLLSLVEDYLKLNRSDKEMQGIRTRLLRREETLAVQAAEMLSKAKELRACCRFDAASIQLRRIPESQHSFEILELLSECEELSAARTAAMSALDAAITSEAYRDGLVASAAYRTSLEKLSLTDSKVQSKLSSCESGAAKSAARVRQQRLLLVLGSVTILCLVVIITAVRIRSARVEAAFDEAAFAAAVARTDARVESARAEEVERIAVSDLALPPLRNSVGMELRLLPSGRFEMGEGSKTHQVTLTKPFYLSVHEVTQSQYQQVMGANPSRFKGAQNPVEQVSCEDAVEFCRKLSELPEEKAAGRVYRLPTEAEWEFACRAGTTTEFSFEDSKSAMDEYAWYDQNSGLTTHPVGQKYPNAWGLYDMHGNVWEWCSDWYDDYPERAVTDPVGPADGSDRVFRVFRGGSWCSSARFFRSASRSSSDPSIRYDGLGFRLALSSSGIPQ